MSALLTGAIVAALALAFVLWPLLGSGRPSTRRPSRPNAPAPRDDSAVRALREIEFDRATGKLSDSDYESLKTEYTALALTELRAAEGGPTAAAPVADAVEALVRAARESTVTCGRCEAVCPEPDAIYCSSCGNYLSGHCNKCGSAVAESGARFCASCGWALAA